MTTIAEPDSVRQVVFSLMTAEEIRARAACEVTSVELFSGGNPVEGGLYDTRMGVTEFGRRCATCHHDNKSCTGHPGVIELAVPVFNTLCMDYTKKVLRCVCLECARVCLPDTFSSRASSPADILHKASETSSSGKGRVCPHCGAARADKLLWSKSTLSTLSYQVRGESRDLTTTEAYDILCRMTDADCSRIGLVPQTTRPEALMFKALPVTPVAVRPPHRSGSQRRDDDITIQLSSIIKRNRKVRAKLDAGSDASELDALVKELQVDVMQLIDNPSYGVHQMRMRTTNRPLRSIASRLKGKEGRVRNNLLGKRVDFSARTVITAEPNISVDEVGIPVRIAMTLTFPEVVHAGNFERLKRAVANGPRVYPGARILRQGGALILLERAERRVLIDLRIGDVVERHMIDGDHVLFNRQPSLHRMSMMCHRVRIMPHDTFRLNVLVTEPYNAGAFSGPVGFHSFLAANLRSLRRLCRLCCLCCLFSTHPNARKRSQTSTETRRTFTSLSRRARRWRSADSRPFGLRSYPPATTGPSSESCRTSLWERTCSLRTAPESPSTRPRTFARGALRGCPRRRSRDASSSRRSFPARSTAR